MQPAASQPAPAAEVITFLNGRFVPESEATISVFDRGFMYGDGLFETVRISNGRAFRWVQHADRLEAGAAFLRIAVPYSREQIAGFVGELIAKNHCTESILRVTLSRGVGVRGYSPRGAEEPVLVMSLHPVPEAPAGLPLSWRARTASVRVAAGDALAGFKTCNKLIQILARAEAEAAGADEALLVNTNGHIVEAASGNLFWVQAGSICTPPASDGILKGITRGVVFELCKRLGFPLQEVHCTPQALRRAEAAFLTQSACGIVTLTEVDGERMNVSPMVRRLSDAYVAQVQAECS